MAQQKDASDNLGKIQVLMSELEYTLTSDGYYKDYSSTSGSDFRIRPLFDKGISLDMNYELSGLDVLGRETIPIITGRKVAFDKIPRECRDDVLRILAELAPNAIQPKTETFIITMVCTECAKVVPSYLCVDGVITCVECLQKK